MLSHLLSQVISTPIPLGNIVGVGPLGNQHDSWSNTANMFDTIISNIIGLLTILAGLYFLFQLILSGYNLISAGGDKALAQNAQKKISNATIGLIIVIAAYALVGLIGRFLGLNVLSLVYTLTLIHP